MGYRASASYDNKGNPQVEPLPGVEVADTTVRFLTSVAEDSGRTVNVQRKTNEMIEIVLTTALSRKMLLHNLFKKAEFSLLVTESVDEQDGDETRSVDVLTTRYKRVKPVSFIRSPMTGTVSLVCNTFDMPQDEEPQAD